MKVCIVAEGCYPYVVGGVSSWIHSMIRSFPNLEFQILAIISNRSLSGKFAYELPENVTQVHEVYLEDFDWDGAGSKGKEIRLNKKEYKAMRSMIQNREIDWTVIFDLFQNRKFSLDKLLMGPDFYHLVSECYQKNYPHIVFSKRSGLRQVIDKLFKKCGGYPEIAYSMEEDQGVAGLVSAGFGIAVVPRMPILSSLPVSIIEIATPSWERLFYMATLKNVYQAPVVTNFKNYVLEHAEI